LYSIVHFTVPHSLMIFAPLTLHDTSAPTKSDFLFDMLYEQQLSMAVLSLVLVVEYDSPILVATRQSI